MPRGLVGVLWEPYGSYPPPSDPPECLGLSRALVRNVLPAALLSEASGGEASGGELRIEGLDEAYRVGGLGFYTR